MTEKELVAKMLETLVKSRKELANIDLDITKKALPDLDKVIEHISAPLMIMVMGEFSTGKSTFINAWVGDEIAAVNATPTTAVITKLCYGEQDKILVHFTDGAEKEVKKASFKQLTAKNEKEDGEITHDNIEYVERQLPLDMLQYVTIIDSPGLNDINEKHSDTTKKFVNNADTVFWLFNALHACSKTEVDALEALTPRLKPIAIINLMDEIDEEEDDPQEFLDNLRVQLKDKVQAVVGISAKYALEGKLENNKTKVEIGNLKEVEQVVKDLVLPNHDKFKLNTLMDELGYWISDIALILKERMDANQFVKEKDYTKYIEEKTKLQNNDEILFHIVSTIKEYCISESERFNEQALYLVGVLFYYGICVPQNEDKAEIFLEKAAIKNHSFSQEFLGLFYKRKGDFEKAFVWLKKAAEQGLPKAQCELGYCYENGLGVDSNLIQATYWLKKASEQGNVDAKKWLDNRFDTRGKTNDTLAKLRHEAECGNADAQFALANCYFEGKGIAKNLYQAFVYFEKSAKQGNIDAQRILSQCYKNGWGTSIDISKANYWINIPIKNVVEMPIEKSNQRKRDLDIEKFINRYNDKAKSSADRAYYSLCEKRAFDGDVGAQYETGYYYERTHDAEKAYYWYRKAAEQGLKEAQYKLADGYSEGYGVPKNIKQAMYWFKKAAEQGDEDAKKRINALQKSGEDDANAQYELGRFYAYNEKRVDKNSFQDWMTAFKCFKKAAEQGHVKAQFELAKCYDIGFGVMSDMQQALFWYRKAAEKGHTDAIKRLSEISKRNLKKNNNKKKSGCFITTAVCNSLNKKDDCYELQMFRKFRDNWLLKQIDGEKLIAEYYRIAPSIVNEIDKCPDSKIIYNNIWNYYLRKCLTMIENNENEKCKQLYIMMVQSLKQKYYND